MKKFIYFLYASTLMIAACNNQKQSEKDMKDNVLLTTFTTPFGVPPFDQITLEDYKQAFETGIDLQNKEIEKIVTNPEAPSFKNTVEMLERSGKLLERTESIFFNLLSANTNKDMQQLAQDIAPKLSAQSDNILMNEQLFKRIQVVYNVKERLELNQEQQRLLEETYTDFVRGGAELNETDKVKLKEINEKLSVLSLQFSENVLDENNNFELVIDNKDDLSGLPESVIAAAAETAAEKGKAGKWVFTLDQPSRLPFLQFADNRSLREKILNGYIMRGDNNNEYDNKEIIKQLVNLRLEKARLLGFETYADFVLARTMAKTPAKVYDLMQQLMVPGLEMAKKEREALQKLANAEGANFKIEAWDWWYYTEKLRKLNYDLDEDQLRPYFKLENVRDGVFYVSGKLFNLKFQRDITVPIYHPDVEAYQVLDSNNQLLGILYMDFFPRASKRGGAWMTDYRPQYYENDTRIIPVISVTCNFTKPTADAPSLLSFDEANTLFHEFGHALHGLLSDCQYRSLSGTNVPRDFVEMPSQIMENWASRPEVLQVYAKHYKTGEVIPEELVKKIEASAKFNAGFTLVEYMSAAYLDMDWHTLKEPFTGEVNTFESNAMNEIGLIPEIVVRYRSTYFNHIFSGGYAAGYYSYVWAEIIDADAFQAFVETSLFDQATAKRFVDEILSKGGTDDPMTLYVNFRGREPQIDALLKRKGLK